MSKKDIKYDRIYKFNKKKNCLECDCGSEDVFCDGTCTMRMPVGFGFHGGGDSNCYVDAVELKGFVGECICGKRIFGFTSKKPVSVVIG